MRKECVHSSLYNRNPLNLIIANKDIKYRSGVNFRTNIINNSTGGRYNAINAIFSGFTNFVQKCINIAYSEQHV
jgi:hypothetical protein